MFGLDPYFSLLNIHPKLLEEHLEQMRADAGNDAEPRDAEDDWNGWEVESDDSDDSEAESWIDVQSEGSDLEISDSEDERSKPNPKKPPGDDDGMSIDPATQPADLPTRIQTLATTKVNIHLLECDLMTDGA